MKRCSFIVCFALIFMLAMPMTVDAYDDGGIVSVTSSSYTLENGKTYSIEDVDCLSYLESNFVDYCIVKTPQLSDSINGQYYAQLTRYDIFFFDDDTTKVQIGAYDGTTIVDNGLITFNSYSLDSSSAQNIGHLVIYYTSYGAYLQEYFRLGSSRNTKCYASNDLNYFYTHHLLRSTGNLYYSDGSLFFQGPRNPGILELTMTGIFQTMEVDPLTEVVKILPIGLACLVGWIGLRKGLSLLRQVLFPA